MLTADTHSYVAHRSQEPSTAKSATKSPASPQFSTPLSQNSAKSHYSTPRSQEELKNLMKIELEDATFQSKSLLGLFCYSTRKTVRSIIANLKTKYDVDYLHIQNAPSNNSRSPIPWPKANAPETEHYAPLAWLMNTILEMSGRECNKPTYHSRLRFEVYDRELIQGEGIDASLKPDLIGIHRTSPLAAGEKVLWDDVHIPVEVKNSWPEMILQMTTYARRCLVFQENKQFIPAIHYNQANRQIRVGLYNRSGLVATEVIDIATQGGFRAFVCVLVGIHSWATSAESGIDPSRTNAHFYLPDGRLYSVKKVLCNRRCVRGKATRVYLIELSGHDEESSSGSTSDASGPLMESRRINCYSLQTFHHQREPRPPSVPPPRKKHRYSLRSNPDPADPQSSYPSLGEVSERMKHMGQPSDRARGSDDRPKVAVARKHECDGDITCQRSTTLSPVCSGIYWTLDNKQSKAAVARLASQEMVAVVLKESWVLASHDNEAVIFKNQELTFGLPTFLFSYTVKNSRIPNGRTNKIIPKDATRWDVFKGQATASEEPEVRIHKRTAFATLGTPLEAADGPRQLVEAIIHAMLGHFNLFRKGWLHRDVSVGNIMIMNQDVRKPVLEFERTKKMTECVGFISDMDQAVQWRATRRERATRRSGTLPFISLRLMEAWEAQIEVQHTTIDDLESFVWVLLWSVLSILGTRGALDGHEAEWLHTMRGDSVSRQLNRALIVLSLGKRLRTGKLSEAFAPFGPLLAEWMKISQGAVEKLMAAQDGKPLSEEDFMGVYEEYINSGLDNLDNLEHTW